MSIIAPLKRRFSRASFVDVLPISAFLLGGFLAIVFTAVYHIQWLADYNYKVGIHAQKMVALTKKSILDDDIEGLRENLAVISSEGMVLTTRDGSILTLAKSDRLLEDSRRYEIRHNDEWLGEIVLVPTLEYRPPLPYWLTFFLILCVAVIAAWMIRMLSQIAARNLSLVKSYVDGYDIGDLAQLEVPDVSFKEFRGLNAVALKTTRRLNREIRRYRNLARRDERTGLPNRYDFEQHLQTAVDRASLESPYAVLMIKLQNWSAERNRFSHGDAEIALKIFGDRIAAASNKTDVTEHGLHLEAFARVGEQTFTVLMSGMTNRDDLSILVRPFRRELSRPIEIGNVSFKPEVAASIVMVPQDGETVQRVFHCLHVTLQSVSETEGTGYKFYTPKLDRQNDARRKLESELREAVETQAFIPVFQPKIDLKTGRIYGVEALARWQTESGRLASPHAFIALAEELGLINDIGEQILKKATKNAAAWVKAGHEINLAVNVSPIQFGDPHLSQMILKGIAESGLPPRHLELEITESVAVQKPEAVRAILAPLRKLGVRLAVDDFGTGHSNLAILTQFKFDTFKIDRSFIQDTPHDAQATAIVDMMLGMARSLGMDIVGEGIETAQQAEHLARRGCHIGQGFFFSKPVSADQITALLSRQAVRKAS
ncbi:MAG: GGDEF domain-containing phosphodiesterase [Pseudomonadota bacterium]